MPKPLSDTMFSEVSFMICIVYIICIFVVGVQPARQGNELGPRSVGLPRKVSKFVGRIDVCEEITQSLATEGDDTTCLITLVAPPGCGKTAVATNVGYSMLHEGKDVLYFSLRNVQRLQLAAECMLKKYFDIYAEENPVLQLASHLSSLQRQTVLILDNAEDLLIGEGSNFEDFLEEIGQHAVNVVTLITSRIAVSKLDVFPFGTKHIPLKPLTVEDSSAYLKHELDISDHWAQSFAKVCHGVPLLLTIAGSFLKNKTIDSIDLHMQLQNCPHSFLKVRNAKGQKLYSLLRVFYSNLGPDLKDYLAYLASFPASFTKEEARDVLFPKEDYFNFQRILADLEQHSLVQQDGDQNNGYYILHPLVQAFCKSSREDTCSGYNTAIRRFSNHYLSLLQRLNDDFIGTDCKTVIDKYDDSKANISHAILASTEDDDDLKHYGLRVSTEAVNFLAKVMKLDEFMSLYSQCLRVAKGMADKTLYSECLVSIGFKLLCYYGYKDAYQTDAKRSLQEAHDLQTCLVNYDSECKGRCKCKLGLCCFVAGDKKKGISLIAQGIGIRKRLVRSEGSGKMERMRLAGGFCDLASKDY